MENIDPTCCLPTSSSLQRHIRLSHQQPLCLSPDIMAFRAVVVAAVLAFASAGMDPGYMNMMGGGMMNMQQMMNMNQMMGGHQQVYILSTALVSILWETLICAGATCSAKES